MGIEKKAEKKAENFVGNYAVENLSTTRQYQSALCHLYFAIECFQLMQLLERADFLLTFTERFETQDVLTNFQMLRK